MLIPPPSEKGWNDMRPVSNTENRDTESMKYDALTEMPDGDCEKARVDERQLSQKMILIREFNQRTHIGYTQFFMNIFSMGIDCGLTNE